jgi:hypothetical protein
MAEMYRVSIKFCFKAGLSATETLVLVQKAYGNEALNRSNVFRSYSRFRNGKKVVENDERGGRPKSDRTEANIAVVANLVKNYSTYYRTPGNSEALPKLSRIPSSVEYTSVTT